jgi:parallel beta-helix repeat protein
MYRPETASLWVKFYPTHSFLTIEHFSANVNCQFPSFIIGRKELFKNVFSRLAVVMLLVSVWFCGFNIQPARASGTVYIRADGSIDPPMASIHTLDNVTYTLDASISDSIVIERDNIVVDGAGYAVQGAGVPDSGIRLLSRSNVTLKDIDVKGFYVGIRLEGSSGNTVLGNNLTNNHGRSIDLDWSDGNVVSGNDITSNGAGIWLYMSSDNAIFGNNVDNNSGYGVSLYSSSDNTISENSMTNNNDGIDLSGFRNTVSGNNITNNINDGVYLEGSNNTFSGNNITNNTRYGIWLRYSSGNTIFGNNITKNSIGIGLDGAPGNGIYHNNFINNAQQLCGSSSMNLWDNGYPSGGNCWSDYSGVDEKSGSNQDQLGSDGIGDTPYVIDSNNRDRYPLMYPWKVTLETDVNADGIVNIVDVTLVAKAFASRPGDHNWDERADIDNNGVVNVIDLGRVCKDFGKKAHALSARRNCLNADMSHCPQNHSCSP